MAHFLLVHGTSHGAWCWRDVIAALSDLGHSAEAIDLPSHGDDDTPIEEVTLDLYADAILARLTRPTILVAHSAGGFAITQAAERDPSLVAGLVYLTGYVPAPGKSLVDMLRVAPSQPLRAGLQMAEDKKSFFFNPEFARDALYHDCPQEAVDFALPRLGPQAMAPQITPATLTGASADLPRRYLFCTDDRAVPLAHQQQMAAGFAEAETDTLPSSHSPFFSMPGTLAQALGRFADVT